MKAIKIELKANEIRFLKEFKKKGMRNAREIMRGNVLLQVNKGVKIKNIVEDLDIHRDTVRKIKKRYLEGGLKRALYDNPRSGMPKKYSDKQEAEIVALACTDPPEGRREWTIRLIAETLKGKEGFETLSYGTVRLVLKKRTLNHGLKECGA